MLCYAKVCYKIKQKNASIHRRVQYISKFNDKKAKFTTNLQWQCEHFCLKIKAFIKGQNYIVNYVIPWYGMMNVNL